MVKTKHLSLLLITFLTFSIYSQNLVAQDMTASWHARQVKSKEDARKENSYRHKINFFFGSYWNTSSKELMAAKIQIKNLKASGKMGKAKKLAGSSEFSKIQLNDLRERAYISNEYGLFALDYITEKGLENLTTEERIFVEKSIYRSLSGPVANRIGYQRLLTNVEGRQKLREMVEKVITDFQSKIDTEDYFGGLNLPKDVRKLVNSSLNESSEQKIAAFCGAAVTTFNEYAAKQKANRELNVGSYGPKLKKSDLVKMSCEDKRLIVYKMIAKASS